MTDLAALMRKAAAKPASRRFLAASTAPADMHPAHRANAIAKARREGDTARLAELEAATPKE